MSRIPNSFSTFVTRKGDFLIDRVGRTVASLNAEFFRGIMNLQEDVEVEMRFRPMAGTERLEEELARVERDMEQANTQKRALMERIAKARETENEK